MLLNNRHVRCNVRFVIHYDICTSKLTRLSEVFLVDINKYAAFLTVIDRGGFNQASEELGYSRSALSKMIGSIESEIGFPLVNRTSKGVALNENGERLLPYIRQLIAVNSVMEEEFSAIKGEETGTLRIGCFPTCTLQLLPKIVRGFNEKHPGITVEVVEEHSLKLIEKWLQQGIIDAGLISRESYHTYGWIHILTEPFVALFHENHPLASQKIVSVKDMSNYNLVLFRDHRGYDQDMVKILDQVTALEEQKLFTNSATMAMRMAEDCDYVAFVPLTFANEAVKIQPLAYRRTDVEVARDMGFAVKDEKNMSPAMRKFVRHVKQYNFEKEIYTQYKSE